MTLRNAVLTGVIFMALACLVLALWSGVSGRPLTAVEVDQYLAEIEAQPHQPGGRHDMETLRAFLEADDGRPVYTVNLYRFHEIAAYPPGAAFSGSGEDAYARFRAAMLPLILSHGSQPVFSSRWSDGATSAWDQIVIIRYRSRRDLADIYARPEFADASQHKWASLRDHDRLIVQATHLPETVLLAVILAMLLGLSALAVSLAWRGTRS
jgi:uncharacterized protein (DUF1330 family)